MKRILSWLLVLVLFVSLVPAEALQVSATEEYQAEALEQTEEPLSSDSVELEDNNNNQTPEAEHAHSYQEAVTEPTCQDPGYTTYTCICGDSYEADPQDALGHAFGAWYDEGEPPCTKPGTQRRDCTRCDAFETRNVNPTGHQYTPYVSEPTYTTEGYTEYICACGDSYVDEQSVVDSIPLPVPVLYLVDGCLEWDCEEGTDGFEIWRATSKNGKYTKVGFTESHRWEDTDYSTGKTYYYKVRSVCGTSGRFISDYSNIVSHVYKCVDPVLTGEYDYDTGYPVLRWNAVTGAKKYEVYRSSTENSGYKKVTTTTKLTYTDTKASVGKVYYYKVKAIASSKTYNSDYSDVVYGSAICARPKVTVTQDAATGRPYITWDKVSGAVEYLVVRVVPGFEDSYLSVQTTRTYLDDNMIPGKYSGYVVYAIAEDLNYSSIGSEPQYVTSTCEAPRLKISSNEQGQPVISWNWIQSAAGYKIYRSTKAGSGYVLVDETTETSYTATDISTGKSYYYKVVAVGDGFESAMSEYIKATGKCAAPELSVEAGKSGKPVLTWNKVAGAKKYEVWRSDNGVHYKRLTVTNKLTYTDTKAPEGGTCTYKIRAQASPYENSSQYSQPKSCHVICAAPTLTVKLDKTTGKPSLSWKKVTGATGYELYRSENGGEYEYLTAVTALSFLDEATRADRQYSYYIKTVGKEAVFNSVASAAKTVTVTVGTAKPAGSVNAAGKPVIAWEAVEDAVTYKVYRSTKSSSSYKLLGTVDALTYTDISVTPGKTYYYKIVTVGKRSESAMSSYAKVTGACAQPEISSIGFNQDSGKPVVSWGKVTGAKKYEIWRSTNRMSGYQKLATVTKNTYADTKAEVGTFYYYKILAVGSKTSYNSALSNPRGCLTVCAKPVVTGELNSRFLPSLSWKAVDGAAGYEIYRATRGGNFVLLATVSEPGYVDEAIQIGNRYRYQVKAVGQNTLCTSGLSEQVVISIPCRSTVVEVTTAENGKPMLTWDAVEGAEIYVIYRSTKKTSGFKQQSQSREPIFTDRGAKKGTTYYYYVTAAAQDTESAKSNTVKIKCAG